MIIELALTHPCDETVHWSAGTYTDRQGSPIEHCPGCFFGVPDEASPVSTALVPRAA